MAFYGRHEGNRMKSRRCEGCDGFGIRVPATPSCRIDVDGAWTIVERCDLCEKFSDDHAAASAVFQETQWIACASGGDHAVGRTRLSARQNMETLRPQRGRGM